MRTVEPRQTEETDGRDHPRRRREPTAEREDAGRHANASIRAPLRHGVEHAADDVRDRART